MNNPVYESVKWLAEESVHVTIHRERLCEVAERMVDERFDYPTWRFPCLPDVGDPGSLEFFFVINSLNFKFWHSDTRERFRATVDGETYMGAFAMFALLKHWYDEEPAVLTGEYLRNLTEEKAAPRLTGDTGPIPLLKERIMALNEVGRVLSDRYGDFAGLLRASSFRCFNHGDGIVERLLSDFPTFRDCGILAGRKLVFNKRAQLAPAMAFARFRGTDIAPISDIDELTAFADYQVPKGLLAYGLLGYLDDLARRIERRELLPMGSREELEIRANTICAVEELLCELNRRRKGKKVNAVQMDYHLWKMARDDPRPYHLTETTAY